MRKSKGYQAQLARAVLNSGRGTSTVCWRAAFGAGSASLADAQRAGLDYRITRHEQSPSDVIPWEQVRAGLFKKP
jgi:hypothetical protein